MTEPGVDVLVAHSLFMALDPKQREKRRPYPPLGTLYVAALLREAGWRVALFDAMLARDEADFYQVFDACRPRLVVLCEDNFNFLSKMCLERMRQAALAMQGHAVAAGRYVLVAGSDATDDPAGYLAAGARAVVLGEPEWTVRDAVGVLLGGRGSLDEVPGLALAGPAAADGAAAALAVRRTAPRGPERSPDRFPWPARDLVDMAAYRREWEAAHGYFSTNMASTRGCPFHCNWCAKPIWGQRYAMRAPAAVAEELAELKRTLAPDHVWFADDIFGLRPDWTVAFGQEVARRGAQLPFQIQSRVDLISPAAAEGLARAGCAEVWLGVESGSQRVLDAMEKGIRLEDVPLAVDRLRAHGIRVGFFLQLGYPGEEWSDIEATAALVRSLAPDEIGVSVSYPLPGTPFHRRVAEQLGPRRHWEDSRDLAMLFAGRYPTDFYRRLHALLHRELAASQALAEARRTAAEVGTARAELAATRREWADLAREESRARQPEAVLLPQLATRPPVPDLSRPAN
jgi:anaerobic magnesium-protoporphyrin IX monomethyl ester cyclase